MVYDLIGEELGLDLLYRLYERKRPAEEKPFISISDKALRRFLATGSTRSDGTRGAVIKNENNGKLKRLSLKSYSKLPPCFTDPMGVFVVGYNSRGQCYCAEYQQLKRCGWKG